MRRTRLMMAYLDLGIRGINSCLEWPWEDERECTLMVEAMVAEEWERREGE